MPLNSHSFSEGCRMEPSTTETDRKRENLYFITKVKGRILPGLKPFAQGEGTHPLHQSPIVMNQGVGSS